MLLATELGAAGAVPSVVTVGNFDGVHRAHAALLRAVGEEARARGWRSVAVTFTPHPLRILNPAAAPRLITPAAVRRRLIAAFEPDLLLELPFSRDLSLLSPAAFAAQVLAAGLGARCVHEGRNFRFGHRHAGDGATLTRLGGELGFATHLHAGLYARGELISSSSIRQRIAAGDVGRARSLLGRPFAITARIARGRGVGRQRTVPTLNLEHYEELLPAAGVYLTRTRLGEEVYDSLTNVGVRPTFGPGALTVETFLLRPPAGGLDPQIGEEMEVAFLRWLRPEARFATVEELKAAIDADVSFAQRFFARLRAAAGPPRSGPEDRFPG